MRLAEKGLPGFRLTLPPKPTAAEEFAADECRRHLLAMLGLPPVFNWSHANTKSVEICINCRDRERKNGLDATLLAPGPETFHWAPVNGDTLFIMGGGDRGTLYAVYELLHRFGCRWFTPDVTRIPRLQTLDLEDKPVSGQPAFEYRDILSWDISDPLWVLRNRLNGLFSPVPAFLGGHDTFGYLAHSCYALVPPSTYFDNHPDYYSEINGVRRHVAGQLCLTHPDVLAIATESLLGFMRDHPEAKLFSVSQMDWEGWCECDACRRALEETGSQSGLYLRFVNAIAEQTTLEFPDKLVTTLAYHYTEAPPTSSIPLHPNVRVQMCPIHTCQIHPFESCGSPQDVKFLDRIRGWSAMTDQLYIWHYATDFSHYSMPLPNLRQLHDNILFYKRNGVRGLFMQANGFSELSDLKGYLVARQLWDPDVTLDSILDEFLPAVYGAAADEIRSYIDLLDRAAEQDTLHHLGCYEPPDHPFYTQPLLEAALEKLQKAERLAKGGAKEKVSRLRGGVDLALLYRKYITRTFKREGRIFHNQANPSDVKRFHSIIAGRRKAGNLPLQESVPLDVTAGKMGLWFERHRLLELRSGSQTLFVAPSLGGRILEWHFEDRQLLEPPDPDFRHFQYPLSQGYAELAIELPYSYRGSIERYTVMKKSASSITLTAEAGDGLRMDRDIRLEPDGLTICGTLTNISGRTLHRQWGAGLHMHVADWKRLAIQTAAGERLYERRTDAIEPVPAVILARENRPAGSWRLDFDKVALEGSFSPDVSSLILEQDDSRNRLAINLRSETIPFAPGQSLAMHQRYRWIKD